MPKSFYSKLAGVTHKNDDGHSRQAIIKHLEGGEILYLEHEPDNQYDPNAISASVMSVDVPWNDDFYQIGYLKSELAAELVENARNGFRYEGKISEITGGEDGKNSLGVNIEITVFSPKEMEERRAAENTRKPSENTTGELSEIPAKKKSVIPYPKWWQWVFGLPFILMFVFSIFVWHDFTDFIISLIVFLGIGLLFFIPQIISLIKWGFANRK
jgi:hypothetical protein